MTLDGWQQAFVVPAGAGGHIVMTFTPTRGYHSVLGGSALAVCVLIALAAWPGRRRPPVQPRAQEVGPGTPPTGAGGAGWLWYWVAAAAVAVVLALVGGVLVAAVPAVLLLGWWRPRWVPWLAFIAMCLAGVLVLTSLGHGPSTAAGAFGWPAQAAALIALAAALAPPRPGTPRPAALQVPAAEGDSR